MARERPLPEGWRIEGFHYISGGTSDYRKVSGKVTDADIMSADRIVVSYTSRRTGVTDYRTIPGATSVRQIGVIIRTQTRVVSPVGRRSR